MARPGAFKSEKRKKELNRQKKQEKKRQRRLGGKEGSPEVAATEDSVTEETDDVGAEGKDEPECIGEKE